MKIKKIEVYRLDLRLPEPFSISFKTFTHAENLLVVISTGRGVTGIGEAAPFKPITGDSREESLSTLNRAGSLLIDHDPCNIAKIHSLLDEISRALGFDSMTARAAIDFACYDVLGKVEGKPIYQILGEKKPRTVPTTLTIGIKKPEEVASSVKRFMQLYEKNGLRRVKLKLSGDSEMDERRVLAAADVFSGELTLDANQGYKDPRVATKVLNSLYEALGSRIILVEEPCPKGELDKMKYVAENCEIPIFADESAASLEDAKKVIEKRAAKGVNIKLQKAGGIYWARKIAKLAEETDTDAMVGSMLESGVSIAAGANFVAGTRGIANTDLDSDLYFPVDIVTQESKTLFTNGARIPSGKPGLGVELEKWIKSTVKGDILLAKLPAEISL